MRVNLDVQSLRSFIKVGELRNFTRAAEVLSMTQPAISQQIRRLEELLSVELFVRDNKQVLLTLEGERLLSYAKEIVSANDKVGELFSSRESREVVTLGMPEHFCEMVLPKIIASMASQFPSVQIVVKVARSVLISEAVNEGKIDIGLIIDEVDHMPETVWHALSVMWFASEKLEFPREKKVSLALFKPPCGFRSLAIRSLEESGIGWQCSYESEDLMSLRSAVQAGVGVTVLPYLSEVKGLRSLGSVTGLPMLPQFAVGLKQRDGWNPPHKREIVNLIRKRGLTTLLMAQPGPPSMCVHMQNSGHTPEWAGPMVERTMRNGQRIYTSAFKAWLVEQARVPGVSVSGLALRHGVNANLLRHWMRLEHWGVPGPAPILLPVTVTQPAPAVAPTPVAEGSASIEIALGEAVVRVPADANLQHLRLVLQALRP